MIISNWGNYPVIEADLKSFSSDDELKNIILNSNELMPVGLRRCYGDSSLNKKMVSSLKFNRILEFDNQTGIITCESGVSLEDILAVFVPKGWFLPTTPGTKFVTIGGAVASDVHGKNHHDGGSFSNHIISMDVMLSDGSVVSCSKKNNPELFWATCGGMGLTGFVLRVTFKLSKIETAYIKQQSLKARNLDHIMEIFEESKKYKYSVAWIDCLSKGDKLGRSLMMRGDHALRADLRKTKYEGNPLILTPKKKLSIPIMFPSIALNTLSVKAFNFLYYNKQVPNFVSSIIDYDKFFYPLDAINNWNRIYGKRGFTQYQFVLPKDASDEGLKKILTKISDSGQGSFLAVLKLFGHQDDFISFPKEGYTLALDFAITSNIFKFLDELDEMVLDYGGRLYLTKDVRMSGEMFKNSYKNSKEFIDVKHKYDQANKFQSLQSKRLGI